jgi:DNA invertase Pin-like site-specific DNA recombinase
LWKKVRGQSILGEDDFVERMIGYIKGYEDIKEIPRSQRYVGRPALLRLFNEGAFTDKKTRAVAIRRAIINHGYSLKEVADFLGIHYSTISRAIGGSSYARNKT